MYKISKELVNVSQNFRKFELVEFIKVRNIGADHLMDHLDPDLQSSAQVCSTPSLRLLVYRMYHANRSIKIHKFFSGEVIKYSGCSKMLFH